MDNQPVNMLIRSWCRLSTILSKLVQAVYTPLEIAVVTVTPRHGGRGGGGSRADERTHVEIVRTEGFPVEEQVAVGLDTMQGQVDRDQDELALDVLVGHGAAVALRVRCAHFEGGGAQHAQHSQCV